MADILIAGGGIGGLTAALALAKVGYRVRLFEHAAAFSEVGAGLQISPNAARILRSLGLEQGLGGMLGRPEALQVSSGTSGAVLTRIPLGAAAERRWGAPSWVVHRADLHAALLAAARADPAIALETQAKVETCAEDEAGVTIHVSTATETRRESGAVLIGADGLWSRVRCRLLGDRPPVFSGRTAFRALLPAERLPSHLRGNVTKLWLGPNAHLVHYPLREGSLVNLVAIVEGGHPEPGWAGDAAGAEVAAHFATWNEAPRALVAAPEIWTRWGLFDREPDPVWPGRRIALLGDAAHPMLPFLAQGAAMAIEDAAVLARHLQDGDIEGGLARYRAGRAPRTARVQREARRNGRVFHLSGALAVARDLGLRLMGEERFAARYDWLYGARL